MLCAQGTDIATVISMGLFVCDWHCPLDLYPSLAKYILISGWPAKPGKRSIYAGSMQIYHGLISPLDWNACMYVLWHLYMGFFTPVSQDLLGCLWWWRVILGDALVTIRVAPAAKGFSYWNTRGCLKRACLRFFLCLTRVTLLGMLIPKTWPPSQ